MQRSEITDKQIEMKIKSSKKQTKKKQCEIAIMEIQFWSTI